MKIDSSYVGMESARTYRSTSMEAYLTTNSLSLTGFSLKDPLISDAPPENDVPDNSRNHSMQNNTDFLRQNLKSKSSMSVSDVKTVDELRLRSQIHAECINFLLQLLFGKLNISKDKHPDSTHELSKLRSNTAVSLSQEAKSISLSYHEESEETTFSTTGTVVTKDGRRIDFGLMASMSREFMEYSEFNETSAAALHDPLVINLDGNLANVSDEKFRFDIDNDGIEEKISRLLEGSGFLAYDKNEDGHINQGSELFGTKSGDGFAELSEYDQDNNGWIDENDEIFSKLRVWSVAADGSETLIDLKEAGVGAIYLGSVNTEFSLNSMKDNSTNAVVRKSGMFLFENGNVGTMQQLDMAVS